MEQTFTKQCDFTITIKGTYSTCNLYEEEVDSACSEDGIWEYVAENMADFYLSADIQTNNIKITLDK